MSKENIKVVCYIRVATLEQLNDRKNQLKVFAKNQGYAISDFVVEQHSGIAPCSETLKELLHNQSVRNILAPNISGLSRNISVLCDILKTAKQEQKNIISVDGSVEEYPFY